EKRPVCRRHADRGHPKRIHPQFHPKRGDSCDAEGDPRRLRRRIAGTHFQFLFLTPRMIDIAPSSLAIIPGFNSIWSFFEKGGVFMIPLVVTSIAALAAIVYKILSLT